MKKVQVLELYGDDNGYTEDYETTRYHTSSSTQWQEISEEDFDLLVKACKEHNKTDNDTYGYKYVVLVYSEKRPEPLIADFLRKMEEEKVKKIRKEKEAEEKKKKKQEEREAAEKAKKLEILRKLQEELGNNLF